jgi:hypothetical protein
MGLPPVAPAGTKATSPIMDTLHSPMRAPRGRAGTSTFLQQPQSHLTVRVRTLKSQELEPRHSRRKGLPRNVCKTDVKLSRKDTTRPYDL